MTGVRPILAGCFALWLSACSGSTTDETVRADGTGDRPTTLVEVSGGELFQESRLLSPDARSDMGGPMWESFNDFEEFADAVDVVFVGGIVGFEEDVFRDGPDDEDPSDLVVVHDGLVFRVDEVLSTAVGVEVDGKITIAHPVMLEGEGINGIESPDTSVLVRVEPVSVIVDHEMGTADGRYIVFATKGMLGSDFDYFFLAGPGSLAPVSADGSISLTGVPPFVRTSQVAELNVEAVTEWIDEGAPLVEIPVEDRPTEDTDS